MSETFTNKLTIKGQQKKAVAEANNTGLNITTFQVGDGNGAYYEPNENQTTLKNTKHTGTFAAGTQSQIIINPSASNEVLYKCFIPADVGGFTIRELGLFDSDGDLILICKLPAQDKFALSSGLYQPLTFTPKIIYTNPATQAVLTPTSQVIPTTGQVINMITEYAPQTEFTLPLNNIDGTIALEFDETLKIADNKLSVETSNFTSYVDNAIPNLLTKFAMNSGNVDANGNADLLYAPGSGTIEATWNQPILTSDGVLGQGPFSVAAVNINTGNANRPAYFAFDGNGNTFTDFVQPFSTSVEKSIIMCTDVAIKMLSLTIVQSLYCVVGFDMWGSNDGTNYTKIGSYTTSALQNSTETILINSNANYKYHKMWLTSGYNTSGGVQYIMPVQININATYQLVVSTATNCLFKVGGLYPDLTITYADKSKEVLKNLESFQGLTINGNYVVIKEKGQNPIAISSTKVTQGKVFPTSPSNGDYHCLTATELSTYKRVSGSWIETQYVILGTVTVSGNVITGVATNPYNQNGYNVNLKTQGYRFPDYSNGVSKVINTSYTADVDGWLYCENKIYQYGDLFCTINSIQIKIGTFNGNSACYGGGLVVIPVSKGDTYIFSSTGTISVFNTKFYPAKGVN